LHAEAEEQAKGIVTEGQTAAKGRGRHAAAADDEDDDDDEDVEDEDEDEERVEKGKKGAPKGSTRPSDSKGRAAAKALKEAKGKASAKKRKAGGARGDGSGAADEVGVLRMEDLDSEWD